MIRITEINNTNLSRIKSILDNSGIIIFPTETVWGIGCKFDDEEAVKKIYHIKGRDFSNPLQIQVSSLEEIKKYTNDIKSNYLERVLRDFLPGPLSIVLSKMNIPDFVTSNLDSVAFRFSSCDELVELINYLGYPLASTSCNKSNEPVISDYNRIVNFAETNADILFDVKTDVVNIASTVIKYDDGKFELLREGFIKYSEIEKKEIK